MELEPFDFITNTYLELRKLADLQDLLTLQKSVPTSDFVVGFPIHVSTNIREKWRVKIDFRYVDLVSKVSFEATSSQYSTSFITKSLL